MNNRKVPMRMCMACREKAPKKELVRVVRDEEGSVTLDHTGKKNGRGAYICHKIECLEKAIKSKALERALEVKIGEDVYQTLREELIN